MTLIKPEGNLFDPKHKQRNILFLASEAWDKFSAIKGAAKKRILTSFTNWIMGGNNQEKQHGYHKPYTKYKNCHTFKSISDKARFHGFKTNVQIKISEKETLNKEVCVVTDWERKKENDLNMRLLDKVVGRCTEQAVKEVEKLVKSEILKK